MTSAIIVAAGSSRRMGFDKLAADLEGKPVVAHAIAAFEKSREIDEILIVTREDRIGEMRALVLSEKLKKVVRIIAGGEERYLSVWEGLRAVSATAAYVAIHDGARPLVTSRMIRECLSLAKKTGAACLATPIPETVKRATADGIVKGSVDRAGLWAMQTPQIFSTPLIVQAYAALLACNEPVTDEVSAVQRSGKPISLLRNEDWNIKITFPRDLEMARQVLQLRAANRKKK